jgi:hypothetical protein
MIKYLPLAALVLAFSNTFSAALEADVSKITSASPARAWEAIGNFCGLSTWHPEVQSCALTEVMGAKLRIMTLKDGGKIRQQLVEQNSATMTMRSLFLDGALPVTNYQATLRVVVTGDGTTYNWTAQFEANGVADIEAVNRITGFYSAGLHALVAKSEK